MIYFREEPYEDDEYLAEMGWLDDDSNRVRGRELGRQWAMRELGRHWAVAKATLAQLDVWQRWYLGVSLDIKLEEEFWANLPDIPEGDKESSEFRDGFIEAALRVRKLRPDN